MHTKNYVLSACLLAGLSVYAQQQPTEKLDEVVVTDSKFELKRENSGKVVVNISREELEQNQGRTLAEVLNTVGGIEINGSRSNAGQSLSYYVRGGNNRQVLVVIDGVQVSDPSAIANDFDLRLLDINSIENIEIIKGAASTLYGNGAATAVINITTKKASGDKIAAQFTAVAGTNESQHDRNFSINDYQNRVGVNGTLGGVTYVAGFGNQYTDGLSAVIDENSDEKDAFSRYNANVKVGYAFSETFKVSLYGIYDHFDTAYDNSFPLEDAPFTSQSDQKRVGLSSEYKYGAGSLTLNAAYNNIERSFESNFPSAYDSDSYIVDIFNKYTFNDRFYTVLGFNYVEGRTNFGEKEETSNADPYVNVVYVSDFGFNMNAGARLNNHSEYGSHFIYNLNPSYTLKMGESYAKVFGSYATSYISPSLTQLYGDFGANPDLEPEEDRTIEGGLEFSSASSFRISGTYFNRREDNFIAYQTIDFDTFESQYRNALEIYDVQGVEAQLEANLMTGLTLRGNYTFTENKDKPGLRVPKHKVNGLVGYTFASRTFASVNYQYTGKRTDTDFSTSENLELKAFGTFDFYLSHTLADPNIKFFVGLNNAFNEEYTELIGYTTRGRNIRFGINLNL
ncbi:MAG TPA: TonB-dependent receptor [Leeuwenhoekiella sp.]|nr:TonB-dependent receptor [Leeuwenhoekiella sp.]